MYPGPAQRRSFYTDGACLRNGQWNSKGGWAVVFNLNGEIRHNNGYCENGPQTNNRYELYAIRKALEIGQDLNTRYITIRTDSHYAINCIENWYYKWRCNNWMTSYGKPVQNRRIIERIHKEIRSIENRGGSVEFIPVRAHSNHRLNNMADGYAKDAADHNPIY